MVDLLITSNYEPVHDSTVPLSVKDFMLSVTYLIYFYLFILSIISIHVYLFFQSISNIFISIFKLISCNKPGLSRIRSSSSEMLCPDDNYFHPQTKNCTGLNFQIHCKLTNIMFNYQSAIFAII